MLPYNMQVSESMVETTIKMDQMKRLVNQVLRFRDQDTKRTFVFFSSADLKLFLTQYRMNIEKCLKSMAMDPQCQS